MTWFDMFLRWAVQPVAFQLWFIRSLFFLNLAYPVLRWLVTRYPIVWFSIAALFWFSMSGFFVFEGQGLFFFSLGIWINKSGVSIDKRPKWFSHFVSWLFFIGVSVIKTFMAFELEYENPETKYILLTLHIVTVSSGIIAVWYGADAVVKWFMHKRWFLWLVAFSFIIYALHVPLIHYVTRLLYHYLDTFPYYRLLTYFLAPVIVFWLCVAIGALFRKWLPKAYRVATGGRGF